MTAQVEIQLSGHFQMIAHGGKRGRVVLAEFDNMILNSGLNYVASGATGATQYCHVGTNNTAAAATQTGLLGFLASTSALQNQFASTTVFVPGPPAYLEGSQTWRFAVGAAAGNLSEVGIGWGSSGATLFSRALIVDGGGSPTSITILSDEQLDVVYTLRIYPPAADVTGNITLGGTNYAYTMRRSRLGSDLAASINGLLNGFAGYSDGFAGTQEMIAYTGSIGSTTSGPSGTPASSYNNGSTTPLAYVANSNQRALEFIATLNGCNLGGGIKSLEFIAANAFSSIWSRYQAEFTPNIPKDATKVLKMTIMYTLARRFP